MKKNSLAPKNHDKYLSIFKIGDTVWIEKEPENNTSSNPLEYPFCQVHIINELN
jgi:hypothetical protein